MDHQVCSMVELIIIMLKATSWKPGPHIQVLWIVQGNLSIEKYLGADVIVRLNKAWLKDWLQSIRNLRTTIFVLLSRRTFSSHPRTFISAIIVFRPCATFRQLKGWSPTRDAFSQFTAASWTNFSRSMLIALTVNTEGSLFKTEASENQ